MVESDNSYILVDKLNRRIEANLSYRTWRRDKWYFARCVELEMTDQGRTKRDAINNLHKMILISLTEAVETKNITAMLDDLGFKHKRLPIPKREYYSLSIDSFEDLNPLILNEPLPTELSRVSA